MVSRERLLELFQYDAKTGDLIRKVGRSGEAYIKAAYKYHGEYARAS